MKVAMNTHQPAPSPFQKIMRRKGPFLAAFFMALFVSTSLLAVLDLLPEPEEAAGKVEVVADAVPASAPVAMENPTYIEIPELGIEATIKNPSSTDVAVLDEALNTGAVRYPTSAKLGQEGNVIIFGHSSYLPVVNNQAFKAFNGIQKLGQGDRILVTGSSRTFVYAVTSVREASASEGEDAIPLTASGHTLTLATCDSFGQKTDRFIVTATLVESYPAGN